MTWTSHPHFHHSITNFFAGQRSDLDNQQFSEDSFCAGSGLENCPKPLGPLSHIPNKLTNPRHLFLSFQSKKQIPQDPLLCHQPHQTSFDISFESSKSLLVLPPQTTQTTRLPTMNHLSLIGAHFSWIFDVSTFSKKSLLCFSQVSPKTPHPAMGNLHKQNRNFWRFCWGSQVELQSQVTWELRQASAQQAQSCARQARFGKMAVGGCWPWRFWSLTEIWDCNYLGLR